MKFQKSLPIFSFFISIFFFFVWISRESLQNNAMLFLLGIFVAVFFIFPLVNGLIFHLFFRFQFNPGKFFFKASMAESPYRQIFYRLTISTSIVILSLRQNINMVPLYFWIIQVVIWTVISIIFMAITQKFTFVHFMRDGIFIGGLDFRIVFPFSDPVRTTSGFYPYDSFSCFYNDEKILSLFLTDGTGYIKTQVEKDKQEGLCAFLKSQGLLPKKKESKSGFGS